jgi:hypothetical protein
MAMDTEIEMQASPATDVQSSVVGYLSIQEAARILGKSPGALYMVLYRNKRRYRTVRAGNAILIPNDTMLALFNAQQDS